MSMSRKFRLYFTFKMGITFSVNFRNWPMT